MAQQDLIRCGYKEALEVYFGIPRKSFFGEILSIEEEVLFFVLIRAKRNGRKLIWPDPETNLGFPLNTDDLNRTAILKAIKKSLVEKELNIKAFLFSLLHSYFDKELKKKLKLIESLITSRG